jgi:TP901 family phage tail tape measure protein
MLGLAKKLAPFAIAAGVVVGGLGACVSSTIETQKALGELASVGVKDFSAMETAAESFSNQWAGTSKAEFIAAAYDIKSGISSLTDTGVAEFTKLAALTGKATKSNTAEMTSLFATGYGIYKGMYADLSDIQFGELFSAGIAGSVKAFKTTGSGMAGAISTLGATATTAKIPLEEQLSILGMLQATMSGSEAGTKYKALMQSAAGAGEKLGLQFMDSNNQLLSMPQILTAMKGKYGETLDAMEKMDIKKAFGTDEAVAVIDLFYGKISDLNANIANIGGAMGNGASFTGEMANTMNQDLGAALQLTGQRWQNLKETIGNVFLPVVVPLVAGISKVVAILGAFAKTQVGRVILIIVGVLSLAVLAVTAFAGAVAAVSFVLPLLSGALLPLIAQVLMFSFALLTCPLTWIIAAVVAVGAGLYWLYTRFDFVRNGVDKLMYVLGFAAGIMIKFGLMFVKAFLDPVGAVRTLVAYIVGAFPTMLGVITGLGERFRMSGAALWDALIAGIKSKMMAPVEVVKSGLQMVRNLLPFSDAKEGPLSTLTLSGARMMETLSGGVKAAAPVLRSAAVGALAGVAAVVGVDTGVLPGVDGGRGAQSGLSSPEIPGIKKAGKQSEGGRIVISNLTVTLPGVADADGFVKELQRLVAQYEV